MTEQPHIPVLLNEVIKYLNCQETGVFVDGTFGAGGYTRAILEANPNNIVYAFDRDPSVKKTAEEFQKKYGNRFVFIADCFGNVLNHISEKVDGFVLDIGVSSMQIDQPERGFSFRFDGPLDMRMAQSGITAREVVNMYSEQELADILFKYGEERASRRIARMLTRERLKHPIITTKQLADLIHKVMPKPKDGSDSAMRTFQALRIFINDELGELERALESSFDLLATGGRLVVVTFHSLEDRIIKNFLIQNSALKPNGNRHTLKGYAPLRQYDFQVVTKKAIKPSEEEVKNNPRAHSAKLRCGMRLEG